MKQREPSSRTRHIVGFVMALLSAIAFVAMLGFVGAIEWGAVSIFFGTVGGITALLLGVTLFYLSSLCLYDYEP